MREVLRSNDAVRLSWLVALLADAGIASVVFDGHMSIVEGSIGALPRRPTDVPLPRNHPGLSEREVQILDGLVKGHPNKVIARTCNVTEATVKVHMKSILRKIRVDNRTQAAIWAMANGYAADGSNGRRLNPDSARNAAAITEAAIRSVATSRGPFSEYA